MPRLASRSFHVRVHGRGLRRHLHAQDAEQFIDDALLEALQQAGFPGTVSFSEPDAVIAIDSIDGRAGMALWSREELNRHPLLRPD